jgi:DUF2892 family protein
MTLHQVHTRASADPGAARHQAHAGKATTRRRLPVNITPAERAGRIVVGVAAVIAGAALLPSAGSALAVVLEALLIAAGVDLAVTGALGHCPLYHKLGYLPRSLRTRLGGPDDRTA